VTAYRHERLRMATFGPAYVLAKTAPALSVISIL